MGVLNDHASLGLPENHVKPYCSYGIAFNYISQNIARPHGRQLVHVSHHYQLCTPFQGFEQIVHQQYVYHGHFINDYSMAVQGGVFIFTECQVTVIFPVCIFQEPVDGFASLPVDSVIRFAALPVGAQRRTFSFILSNIFMIDKIMVVFPVPGPPLLPLHRLSRPGLRLPSACRLS